MCQSGRSWKIQIALICACAPVLARISPLILFKDRCLELSTQPAAARAAELTKLTAVEPQARVLHAERNDSRDSQISKAKGTGISSALREALYLKQLRSPSHRPHRAKRDITQSKMVVDVEAYPMSPSLIATTDPARRCPRGMARKPV